MAAFGKYLVVVRLNKDADGWVKDQQKVIALLKSLGLTGFKFASLDPKAIRAATSEVSKAQPSVQVQDLHVAVFGKYLAHNNTQPHRATQHGAAGANPCI